MNLKEYPSMHVLAKITLCVTLTLVFIAGGCDQREETASTTDPQAGRDQAMATTHTHAMAGETCFICDPNKREAGRLWCREHGRYEDRCWLCHPELEDKNRLYCTEHFLYEDECHLCHPELKPSAQNNTPTSQNEQTLFCNEHGVPEIECGICQPQLAGALQPGESLKVRLPSEESATKAGLHMAPPTMGSIRSGIQTYCETRYNENVLAHITPLVDGVVRRVHHDVGDRVSSGAVLVELHSALAAAAKSDYLSARVAYDIANQTRLREKKLVEQKIGAQKDYLEAEAAWRMAKLNVNNLRQKLINIGFNNDEIERIEQNEDASAIVTIRAPFDGTLVERVAVVGEAVGPGDALFTLADLSTLWLDVSIPADHIASVRVGQTVEAVFPELPEHTFSGTLSWIDTAIESRSRMIRARAVLSENLDILKVGLFGRARILTHQNDQALLVPRNALQQYEQTPFVFVQQESDLFALRRVQAGPLQADAVEILAGLTLEDEVVTDGAAVLMTEFLKSRLGAGCADE